jgi:hypothetical protein
MSNPALSGHHELDVLCGGLGLAPVLDEPQTTRPRACGPYLAACEITGPSRQNLLIEVDHLIIVRPDERQPVAWRPVKSSDSYPSAARRSAVQRQRACSRRRRPGAQERSLKHLA